MYQFTEDSLMIIVIYRRFFNNVIYLVTKKNYDQCNLFRHKELLWSMYFIEYSLIIIPEDSLTNKQKLNQKSLFST